MSGVVAEARALSRTYPIGGGWFRKPAQLHAVSDVSFRIEDARTLAVVGESGSGKSTLGRMVALIEPPNSGGLSLIGVDAVRPPAGAARNLRRAVQVVFQNPYGSLNPRKKVGTILAQPLAIATDMTREERRQAVHKMMERVGLRPEHAARYPHMFSGGQRQRIAIARALMLSPKLLVADEPVSALDVSVQAQVLNLFSDLQSEFGVAYLFISHDLAVVKHLAHEVLVLYLGLVMEQGPKDLIFARPLHPYTRVLLAATPTVGGEKRERIPVRGELPSPIDPPKGCVFSTRCPLAIERCRAERPALRPVDGRMVACHLV
jgi:dipeptide transport system ATP-binding protein